MNNLSTFFAVSVILLFGSCYRPIPATFVPSSEVQLSKPLIRVDRVFFYDTARVYVGQTQHNCQVHFSEGNYAPDLTSPVAKHKLTIKQSGTLRFRSMGGGFLPSEETRVELFKLKAYEIALAQASSAKAPYNQAAADILIDRQKASKNFRDGGWMGYQQAIVSFELTLDSKPIQGVALSCLEDQHSWIFAPSMVEASFYDEANQLIMQTQNTYDTQLKKSGNSFQFIKIIIDEIRPAKIKLVIRNLASIPSWHPGSGNSPWLFIDEIVLL